MESGWSRNSFNTSSSDRGGGGDDSQGHNGNFTNGAWDIWDIATSRVPEESVVHALLFGVNSSNNDNNNNNNNGGGPDVICQDHRHLYGGGLGSVGCRVPDPHMMCLKLGKRHYCEDAVVPDGHVAAADYSSSSSTKRTVASPAAVARCQVEGCHVALSNAKEYYKRHKVCEIHSKAPKVVVLGLQQRFCQQCSRFEYIKNIYILFLQKRFLFLG